MRLYKINLKTHLTEKGHKYYHQIYFMSSSFLIKLN